MQTTKKDILIPLEEIQVPTRNIQGLKVGFLKSPEGWCSCIPQTILLLQRYGYDIYIENNISENWKNEDYEKYLCNIQERKTVISICDVIISFYFDGQDISSFHHDQIIITERQIITENFQQQLLDSGVEVITLDTIPFQKEYLSYSSTYAKESGKGKGIGLISIDELGIVSSNYKYQALITEPKNVSLVSCAEILHRFNISLTTMSTNPDIIITDKPFLNSQYKRGTIIIPITNEQLQFDQTKYTIIQITNNKIINKHISLSLSFTIMNFLKYCRFNGFFNKEDKLSSFYSLTNNQELSYTQQTELIKELQPQLKEVDIDETSPKENVFLSFIRRYFNKSYLGLIIVITFLILITVWGSFQNSIETTIKDPILICVLSCVVGAFMARRISPSIHIPTVLLLLSISCSIGYTCLDVMNNFKDVVGTSYRQYGPVIVDLFGLLLVSIILTSSIFLVIKTMKFY
ncbi:hypothetical protein KM1_090840 [Entamoeba histolytica HM-3:IMSS]|uniref:Uncharacterized protein n=5 Tax=Entamoeba histolytica TaxID=5759 RepID=C4LWQ5_ENTH1|nr:hypothetical protein EHI_198590 [Entamoeba histolytica HM-1:IMSS]EMD43058.1 Hypothetical protein EHI5A_079840 [Entamoeba histolytica KU27]EMS11274.1 hypothetical protein KM1_090840 [Entamoeba histolytica HM-3:IMSS]ENY65039.1 hypothetical protein EHI7A_046040 [Entamoeba histolytica HM-1:IMSS-A]GAT93145.1 hypothetical protein CL6EHI_198590 [Entamoeba histolytica]EAL49811.1 hypothetical protein EHI_198590 [Entamoeba histolytica HM-1:IMSS]|eukprot:XP_655198.1 hypothetical protein EHI_198590 [Entamoeba histolytica HM-1:IMSS]